MQTNDVNEFKYTPIKFNSHFLLYHINSINDGENNALMNLIWCQLKWINCQEIKFNQFVFSLSLEWNAFESSLCIWFGSFLFFSVHAICPLYQFHSFMKWRLKTINHICRRNYFSTANRNPKIIPKLHFSIFWSSLNSLFMYLNFFVSKSILHIHSFKNRIFIPSSKCSREKKFVPFVFVHTNEIRLQLLLAMYFWSIEFCFASQLKWRVHWVFLCLKCIYIYIDKLLTCVIKLAIIYKKFIKLECLSV